MRSLQRTPLLLLLIALALCAIGVQTKTPPVARAIEVEPVIWQLDKDYPDEIGPDISLPINTVYIKTHDETYWMSEFDDNPNAVSGPASIHRLIDIYAREGVEVAAWFVPKGSDFDRQVQMAVQVIDTGVKALYADLEPFQGFCYLECATLAQNFWSRVRAERPNATLGVIYDPRPWWWDQSATSQWMQYADAALPMCYWETFAGQGPWGEPGGCVTQAHADLKRLAPGRTLEYIPMLQGDSTPDKFEQALDAAVRAGSSRVSVWRRGVVPTDIWGLVANYQDPSGPFCGQEIVDGCLIREASEPAVYLIAGGAKFYLTAEAFAQMGFDWRHVQVVPLGLTAQIPDIPLDGTLFRDDGDAAVWLVAGGARFHVASLDQFFEMGFSFDDVRVVPPGGVAGVPLIPRDYSRLREFRGSDEYLVLRGGLIPLDNDGRAALAVEGRGGQVQDVVPDGGLAQIPIAQVPRGDSDCSGDVAPIDLVRVLQYSISLPQPGLCTHMAGDADCDGYPMAPDALIILRFVGGSPVTPANGCAPVGMPEPLALPRRGPSPTPSPAPTPTTATSDTEAPSETQSAVVTETATPEPTAVETETPSATATPTAAATETPLPPSATPAASASPTPFGS